MTKSKWIIGKFCYFFLSLALFILPTLNLYATALPTRLENDTIVKLKNPIATEYLKKKLRKNSPRLILTASNEKTLKNKLKKDPVVQNLYKVFQLNAEEILKEPLLEREVEGRRLLAVSRKMLFRMNILCMVYRMDKDPAVLKRINDELLAVCNFQDWNPSHFLDVAEMAMAVAIAVDWTGMDLPGSTVALAKDALIEKGIKVSYENGVDPDWVRSTHNWNQVCNGGMIAASIIVAEKEPELAAKTISRALEAIPYALEQYRPDGAYPEGPMYWGYGTSFSVLTSSMLESAFGTDFGIAEYPGFKESADFILLSTSPTDRFFNFGDCVDRRSSDGNLTMAWFAAKTGNKRYFERERFLKDPEETKSLSRLAGAGLVWVSQFEEKTESTLPLAWKGDGKNPVVFFRGKENDPRGYYFGGKGGRGTVNHGNMDAGSFVFELDGVRWVVDPGNQPYHELEQAGFNLWDDCQECERWDLITKNNFGHSTLTINNALHVNDGFASITDFKDGNQPEATVNMTEIFGEDLKSATRRFIKEDGKSLLIEDKFTLNDATQTITWQLITTADVEIVKGGALLKQDGKQLKLENLTHPELVVSIISLDPPPLKLDRQIKNLKRLEIRMPAYIFSEEENIVRVRLSSPE